MGRGRGGGGDRPLVASICFYFCQTFFYVSRRVKLFIHVKFCFFAWIYRSVYFQKFSHLLFPLTKSNGPYFPKTQLSTFTIRFIDHKQTLWVEARGEKIEQMYENLELDLDLKLKLLFMVTGAYYESGLCTVQTLWTNPVYLYELKAWYLSTKHHT